MNRLAHLFLLVIFAFALLGCGRSPTACTPRKGVADLRSLKVDQAANDAASAFHSGNHRFLGVYGYSVEIPGLAGDPYLHVNETKMLEGTSDVFCTEEEEVLNKNARSYARKYNEAMLNLINSKKSG